jgi:hypothetical protein
VHRTHAGHGRHLHERARQNNCYTALVGQHTCDDSASRICARVHLSAAGNGCGRLASPEQAQGRPREAHVVPELPLHIALVLVCEQLGVVHKEHKCGWPHRRLHIVSAALESQPISSTQPMEMLPREGERAHHMTVSRLPGLHSRCAPFC